jgi:hypothetical protein
MACCFAAVLMLPEARGRTLTPEQLAAPDWPTSVGVTQRDKKHQRPFLSHARAPLAPLDQLVRVHAGASR